MEITEKSYGQYTIQLSAHEQTALNQFCNMVYIDVDSLIHLFFRSLYNFVIQYLMIKNASGT